MIKARLDGASPDTEVIELPEGRSLFDVPIAVAGVGFVTMRYMLIPDPDGHADAILIPRGEL